MICLMKKPPPANPGRKDWKGLLPNRRPRTPRRAAPQPRPLRPKLPTPAKTCPALLAPPPKSRRIKLRRKPLSPTPTQRRPLLLPPIPPLRPTPRWRCCKRVTPTREPRPTPPRPLPLNKIKAIPARWGLEPARWAPAILARWVPARDQWGRWARDSLAPPELLARWRLVRWALAIPARWVLARVRWAQVTLALPARPEPWRTDRWDLVIQGLLAPARWVRATLALLALARAQWDQDSPARLAALGLLA